MRELEELWHRAQVRDSHQALATAAAQQEAMEEEGEEESERGEEGTAHHPLKRCGPSSPWAGSVVSGFLS